MKAVILIAGTSRRLLPLTEFAPKCLIEVGGKAILDHQLEAIEALGITDLVVVTGYRREQINEALASRWSNFNITNIVNHQFFDTNTAYSLLMAKDEILGESFLYFNGDVIFPIELPKRLLDSPLPNPMAIEVKPCGTEEVKVIVNDEGRIVEISKQVDPKSALGEFIGVARFDASFTVDFFDRLELVIAAGERTAYFERAVEHLAKSHLLTAVDVSDLPCIEIDFPEDLAAANKMSLEAGH